MQARGGPLSGACVLSDTGGVTKGKENLEKPGNFIIRMYYGHNNNCFAVGTDAHKHRPLVLLTE